MGKTIQLPKAVNQSQAMNSMPRMAYNIEKISDTVTELQIYDEIAKERTKNWWTGEETGTEVTPQSFKDELNEVSTDEIVVRINSAGGEVTSANTIAVAIEEARHRGKKISCKIDGMCASAAVQIALACSPVMIHQSAYMMIHNPMAVLIGYYNSDELQQNINFLNSIKQGIMNTYVSKTGLSERKISKMMDETKYMDGKEAVELGFADSLMFEEEEEEEEEEIINRISTVVNSAYDYFPEDFRMKFSQTPKKKQEVVENMTREELEKKYPDIVNTIRQDAINSIPPVDIKEEVNKAVNAERERMKAIDEMAGKVDAETLNKAKYETFETAEKVALNAIREGKFVNTAVINAMAQETAPANAVNSVPNAGAASTGEGKETEVKNVEKLASEYLKSIGRGA